MNNSVTNIVPIGNSYVPENFKFWDLLKQQEDKVIKAVLSYGYLNPLDDPDQLASLEVDDDRLFIKSMKFVDYDELEESNVRANRLDEQWAEREIKPLIEKRAKELGGPGLMYPIQGIVNAVTAKISILAGHHRAWALHLMGKKIPVLILTKPINSKGGEANPNGINLAKARSNPRQKSLQMGIKDAVLHLDALFKEDPTFRGRNPSGKKPPRGLKLEEQVVFNFNDLMDWAYGGSDNFVYAGTRGKIYYQWTEGGPKSKLMNTSLEANITQHLVTLGLNSGIKENGSRRYFLQHIDEKKKTLIIQGDDNGNNFGGKVWKFVVEWLSNPTYQQALRDKGIKYLTFIGRLYEPPVSFTKIKTKRNAFVKDVKLYGTIVEQLTGIKLRQISMPQEIQNAKDIGYDEILIGPKKGENIIVRKKK